MDVDELLEHDKNDIKDYILNAKESIRKDLLSDKKIKKFFCEGENFYTFIWLVQQLDIIDIELFIDHDFMDYMFNSTKLTDMLNFFINSDLKIKNKILNNDRIIREIINNKILWYDIKNLDEIISTKLIDEILKEQNIELFRFFNDNQLNTLLNHENIQLLKQNNGSRLFRYLPINILEKLMNDSFFIDEFCKLELYNVHDLLKKGFKVPRELEFFIMNTCLSINDINKYRDFVNCLLQHNLSLYYEIEKQRVVYYDMMINNIDNGIFSKYYNIESISDNDFQSNIVMHNDNIEDYLRKLTKKQILEMICDKYFGDYLLNVLINIQFIVSYSQEAENNIISKEHMIIYKNILNFNKLTLLEQCQLYRMIPTSFREKYYDDYRNLQDDSINRINACIPNLNQLKKEIYEDTPIYVLDGQEFKMPIHCMSVKRDEISKWKPYHPTKTLSISLIGNEELGCFGNPKESIVVGFSSLDKSRVMHMYHTDSFTELEESTIRINELFTPQCLLNKTQGYNEILYNQHINDGEQSALQPTYLICYDEVTPMDIMNAKSLGDLSIIKIDTLKYKDLNAKKKRIFEEDYNYVTCFEDIRYEERKRNNRF